MTKPSECRWCGAGQIASTRPGGIYFGCWSYYEIDVGRWNRHDACVDRVTAQAQTEILREQIRQAVATLRAIQRYEVTPYTSRQVSWERTPDGPWILHREVETVVDDLVRTLEGET
jgi:hypothetical protein